MATGIEAARKEFSWSWPQVKSLVLTTYKEWTEDDAPHMGASLAFYTMLSLAPLLVITLAIAGWALGEKAASGQLMDQIRGMVGSDGAQAIEAMIKGAGSKKQGAIASIAGFVMLFFGATSVVGELRLALNRIWNVPKSNEGFADTVKKTGSLFALVLASGFMLLVSLVVSAGLAAAGKYVQGAMPAPPFVIETVNFLVSIAVLGGIFAVIFKFLPEVKVAWRDVLLGSGVTAVLFTIGKFLIGLYLGKASFGSTYGAAGSLVIVLVWVYYSSQIFFFGAEFTQVYSRLHGSNPFKGREKGAAARAAKPVEWMAYGSAAASGNSALPPILPLEVPRREPDGIGAVLGGLIGAAVALGKGVVRGIKE
ncbi:MAG TPA: YihY/virulence factor BrkB family protein [Bryobacteraceae bacterium]|nr:YihY/virulence factor BrkB family protein [Bryobacteraceae bacterium]